MYSLTITDSEYEPGCFRAVLRDRDFMMWMKDGLSKDALCSCWTFHDAEGTEIYPDVYDRRSSSRMASPARRR